MKKIFIFLFFIILYFFSVLKLSAFQLNQIEKSFDSEVKLKHIYRNKDSDEINFDNTLLSFDLNLEANLYKNLSGIIDFNWDGNTPDKISIDEAYLKFDSKINIKGGKLYLPFGDFETNFISDPLTQELGEIRDKSISVEINFKNLILKPFIFKPSIKNRNNNLGWGFSFKFDKEFQNVEDSAIEIQFSYINTTSDNDNFKDFLSDNNLHKVENFFNGISVFFKFEYKNFAFIGEIVKYVKSVYVEKRFKPLSWNFELGYNLKKVNIALRYEGSKDTAFIDEELFMNKQYGISVSIEIFKNINLSFEFLHGKPDRKLVKFLEEDINKKDTFSTKLHFEF